ncbi:MAG TPA: hypothetical protein VNO21_11970 [Polyangiaceae bacterium]|nr:hypothetical protein [Polyangiaceae bacterium]
MALFDYVLRGGGASRRDVFAGALRPAIVLLAVIAFLFALPRHKAAPPQPKRPTEVKFVDMPHVPPAASAAR